MSVNMFDSPIAGQYMNTYARLPFQEIAVMGDQLRKRSNDTLDMISANEDLMNLPVMDIDVETRDADQAQKKAELEEIASLHAAGEYDEAQRRARRLGSGLKTWKEQGRGYNMAEALKQYNENTKMFDSAVAKGVMTAEQAAWEKQEARSKYGGVNKGAYQSTLPTVIDKSLVDQAIAGASGAGGWAADKNYKFMKTEDGAYYINEKNERVEENEVKSAMSSYLMSKPENIAWANRQADFMMKDLDPNQDSFDVNGKTYTREEFKNKIVEQKINEAADVAAKKVGYTSKEATLTADVMFQQALKARAKALEVKPPAETFALSAGQFVKVTDKNVDELRDSANTLRKSSQIQAKSVDAYKKANPNASLVEGDPNYDPVYFKLNEDLESTNLQLTEHDAYLEKPKTEADKLINANVGDFQFLDFQNPANTTSYGKKDNLIYYFQERMDQYFPKGTGSAKLDEALAEARSGKTAKKLDKILKDGIRDGLELPEVLQKELGDDPKLIEKIRKVTLKNIDTSPQARLTGEFVGQYSRAKSKYSDAIVEAMKDDVQQVNEYRMISAIENGKYASNTAKLQEEVGKDIVATAGQGYSVPTGGQLDQYMKDEFGEGWMEKYKDWTKNGKVKVLQTSGFTASGKGILNLSITDSSGKLHNIPIIGKDNDLYLRTGQEMSRSDMDATRNVGESMVMNASITPNGTTLGAIIQGASMGSMFTSDNKPRQGVKSPLYGFKTENGSQLYVAPKGIAGDGMKLYKIVDKDGNVIEDNIGGSVDLRERLHSKLIELNKDSNPRWVEKYGLGK